jgi:hypothetical protein
MSAGLKEPANDDKLYVRTAPPPAGTLPELAVVRLGSPARTAEGDVIPAGALGAIVAVWSGGAAYDVEFAEPLGALATVPLEHLQEVKSTG